MEATGKAFMIETGTEMGRNCEVNKRELRKELRIG